MRVEHYALPAQVWGAGLVFARVGALAMTLPGIGETSVPTPIRLAFAFLLSLMLYPVVAAGLPGVPADLGGVAGQVILQSLIGLGLGTLVRLFLSSLAVAGEIVSLQTTLSFAQTTNPLGAQPTASLTTFLSLLGLTLVFATDLHGLFIAAIARSFDLFPVAAAPPTAGLAALAIRTVGETFALGVQLSAPVLVFSLFSTWRRG